LLEQNELIFTEVEVAQAIQNVNSFDPEYLDYYNFLESIVRVAKARPWTEEEQAELQQFDSKLDRICNLLESRFHEEVYPNFEAQRENFEHERRYQPRLVVDDDARDSEEDDDNL